MKNHPLLGAHLSVAGGLANVFERAEQVGATAIQIFVKNNKAYFSRPITLEEQSAYLEGLSKSSVKSVVAHAGYLINLGASNPEVEQKSIASLKDELARCEQLAIQFLVLHPGAHTGLGVEKGVAQISRNLTEILRSDAGKTLVLLETAAGQGTTIGRTFEEMRALYDACEPDVRHRIGICLDTCHVFASGYHLATAEDYKQLWEKFDAIIGRPLLKVIHLNGSKEPCGSGKDRHANIGSGHIPADILKLFVVDSSNASVSIVLETPSEDGITEYKNELAFLRE